MDRSLKEPDLDCQDYNRPYHPLIKDRAFVVDIGNGIVTLRIPVYSACAGCHSKCLMSGDKQERILRLPLPTALHIQPGDYVDLHISPQFVSRASFYIYLLPAIILLVFAYFGRAVFVPLGLRDPDLGSLLAIFISIPFIVRIISFSRKKMGGVENIHIITRSQET